MATASRSETLSNIDAKLREISGALGSMSAEEKARFDNSDIAAGMAGVFKGVGGVLDTQKGIASGSNARTLVKNGEKVVSPDSGDAMRNLIQQNIKLQKAFEQEKATRSRIEAEMSISDQKNQEAIAEAAATASAVASNGDTTSTTPTAPSDGNQAPAAEGATAADLTTQSDDPVALALTQAFNEQKNIINQRLSALEAFTDAEDDDFKQSVKNIRNLAESQIARAEKENERLARAARVAGIVSGRGQYSPEEHEGIVSEVIQEGLARIEDIEFKAQEATLAAKKAHREFRYKAFVDATDMVETLTDLKRQTIVDIAERLRQVEQDSREKQRFDAEMADRNAFILAPELQDATPEEIEKAALANGIEVGALMREIQAYKQEQETYDLDTQLAKERILSEQQSRRIEQAKFDRENKSPSAEEALTPAELEKFANEYGLRDGDERNLIPTYWTRSDLDGFINKFPNAPTSDLPRLIKQYEDVVVASAITDDAEREAYLAAVIEPTETVVADVTNRVRNEAEKFFRQAKSEGDASMWRNKTDDVTVWVAKPATQQKIEDLANSGLTAYQVYEELKRLYADEKK